MLVSLSGPRNRSALGKYPGHSHPPSPPFFSRRSRAIKRKDRLVAVSSRSPRLILLLGERNFAARLTERETKASEAKQHHGPSRRFGNRRNGEGADAEPLGSPLAIGIAAGRLSWAEEAEDIIIIP